MRKRILLLTILLFGISLLANIAFATPPQPNNTAAVQKAKGFVEAFRDFRTGQQSSYQEIEKYLAIEEFIKRSISNYWNDESFASYRDKVVDKFKTILRESIYGQMKDIFKDSAVQNSGRYIEAYRQINTSSNNPTVIMSCLQSDSESETGISVMNLEFKFEQVGNELKIVDITYYWHLDCPINGAAVLQWRKGNRYFENRCDGCVENTQSVWLRELPENISTPITKIFRDQITQAIDDGGGGVSGYNNLIRSMDARIEQIR